MARRGRPRKYQKSSNTVFLKGSANLRISKITQTKIKKGTITKENFAKNLAKTNAQHMARYFRNAEVEFVRIAKNSKDLQSAIDNIKTAYRSQLFKDQSRLYKSGKGVLLAESMSDIIEKKLTNDEIQALKASLNITELDFSGWTWNEDKQRLEDPTHKYYITVEGSSSDGDYAKVDVNYGQL